MASHWRKLPLQVRLQQIFELKMQLNGDFGDAITPIDMMNQLVMLSLSMLRCVLFNNTTTATSDSSFTYQVNALWAKQWK